LDYFATKTPGEHDGEQINEQINRQSELLAVLEKNPSFTLEQISKATKISMATLRREMKVLKDGNRIERIGSNKTGYWKVL